MSRLKQAVKSLATRSFDNQQSSLIQEIIGSTTVSLLDVGAANGAYDRWSRFKHRIDYFAVEPDSRSTTSVFKSSGASAYNSETLITKALWHSEGEVVLNLCRKPMASSIYEPNRSFIDLFPEPERNDVVDKLKLPCETVDRIAQQLNTNFDVLKLDVQGAELDVLRGATNSLAYGIAIDIEVEFCELYKEQPLFDQVFTFLRKAGFEFIDFTYIYRWSPNTYNGLGQATFSDALFMRAPERVAESGDSSMISKFVLICAVYERGDLLLRLGNACKDKGQTNLEATKQIIELGKLVSRRNARTQRQLDRVTKAIRLFHPRVRAHIVH
ncbi:MAG: FkbM family methyltransferase [Ilumatobacteraceae bacterium]|jgi:FkbM family methyltransferase